ncbi:MAG: transcription antitermination factor NusB [Eubacteriales bacterium]|nr:transcription antitermination factor NusB [Eubacteriales bacterium]MDD4324655.1 transcription antitermination factor NusB [Eubacteriales bacterium]
MTNNIEKVDAARLAACRVLRDVLHEGAFSNESSVIHLSSADLDSRDRAFASAMIYGTLSRLPLIDAWLEIVSARPFSKLDPWMQNVLRLGAWQLHFSYAVPAHTAVDESVNLIRFLLGDKATAYVNGVLRSLSRELPSIPAKKLQAYELGLSTELYGLLRHWYGDESAREIALAALESPSTQTVRMDLRRKDELQEWLSGSEAHELEAEAAPWPEEALNINLAGKPINDLSAYRKGLFTVQSSSAMLPGSLLPEELLLKEDLRVIDLCSAPGGKIGHLAERLSPKAKLIACDVSAERLQLVREFMESRNHTNVEYYVLDASEPLPFDSSFDLVLCDVPCSGLGLLARRPEIRLRASYEAIERLKPLQSAILQEASCLVALGGWLYYTSCTINPEENSGQIKAFLESDRGQAFALDNLRLELPPALMQTYDTSAERNELGGDVTLLAHRDGSDGFYLARMRRKQ